MVRVQTRQRRRPRHPRHIRRRGAMTPTRPARESRAAAHARRAAEQLVVRLASCAQHGPAMVAQRLVMRHGFVGAARAAGGAEGRALRGGAVVGGL